MYLFIVNPNSRSGLGHKIWCETENILKQRKIEYKVYFTEYQKHAIQIARDLTADGSEHTLVVLGGDGTIGEVLTGICFPEKITLGYLPVGSGNDFARGLGIPKNSSKALDIILNSPNRKKIDIGVLHYDSNARRFGVSTGFGYDAAICHAICVSKLKKFLNKFRLGKLAYVSLSIHCLLRCTPKPMTIILDDRQKLHFQSVYFTTLMNLPYEGGGCKFCPKANASDHYLDMIVVADVPKIYALFIIPTVFLGLHTLSPGVHIYRCQKAALSSQVPLAVHADGEPIFLKKDLEVNVADTQINLIVK